MRGRLLVALAAVLLMLCAPLGALLAFDLASPERPLSRILLSNPPTFTPVTAAAAPTPAAPTPLSPSPSPSPLPATKVGVTPTAGPPPGVPPPATPPAGRFEADARIAAFTRPWGDFPGRGNQTNSLGWATAPAAVVAMAYQPFEGWRGQDCQSESSEMLWRSDTRTIYFLVEQAWGDNPAGCPQIWQAFPDTWREGDPSNEDIASPSDRRLRPVRGFGRVWREQLFQRTPGLGDGFATAREVGFNGVIQPFENGLIIAWPERNRVWVFFNRFAYTAPSGRIETRAVWVGVN